MASLFSLKLIIFNIILIFIAIKNINCINNEALKTLEGKIDENTIEKEINKADKSKRKQSSSAQQYGMNGRHFCFYGSAGTGKTTIARIIAGFLYKYGYITENKCVEIDGNFLKAGEMTDICIIVSFLITVLIT